MLYVNLYESGWLTESRLSTTDPILVMETLGACGHNEAAVCSNRDLPEAEDCVLRKMAHKTCS